jgi:hypothetical protein
MHNNPVKRGDWYRRKGGPPADTLEMKKWRSRHFPDFEKLGLDGSVDSLEILRDLNNSKIDDLLGQANQAMNPPEQ